jgi:Ca2+-binding RTX toxin-like protein
LFRRPIRTISTIFYVYNVDIGDDVDFLWNVEEVQGTNFADTMTGVDAGGNDHFAGGGGSDTLDGQGGNDVLEGGDGNDTLNGGDDYDVATYENEGSGAGLMLTTSPDGTTYTVTTADGTDTLTTIEEVRGTIYDDTMTGGDGNDHFVGGEGNDTLDGGAGNDTSTGGAGADTFVFLRYGTDGNPLTAEAGLGDGNDVVTDFNVTDDTILFLVNETFTPTAEIVTDDPTTTEIVEPDGTLITYATDSTILLVGVFDADLNTVNIQEEMIIL